MSRIGSLFTASIKMLSNCSYSVQEHILICFNEYYRVKYTRCTTVLLQWGFCFAGGKTEPDAGSCSCSQTVLRKSTAWSVWRLCTITNERQAAISTFFQRAYYIIVQICLNCYRYNS